MRILFAFAVVLAACGSTLSPGVTAPRPSSTPVPWVAAAAQPTPIPDPTVPPRPTDIRDCGSAELGGGSGHSQGAGGWWIRTVVIADLGASPCVISGPRAVEYLDAAGATIVAADGTSEPTWGSPGWVVLEPTHEVRLLGASGEALVILQTYGDCAHATLGAVRLTFSGSTGTLVVPVEPQLVGGRCDNPTQRLGLASEPLHASVQPPYPPSPPSPLAFLLEVPSVAFAGEPLSYVVRIRNGSPAPYVWNGDCPLYLEWLGGRDVSPTNVPGRIVKPLYPVYAGTAKESHTLNCATAGAMPAGGERAFEIHLDLPRDAVGPENLCWAMLPPPQTTQVCTTIEFLPPRQ